MKIAVVIPCYKCKNTILDVIDKLPGMAERIYVVDDACPDKTGDHVKNRCIDPRVRVLTHKKNQGVGGAVTTGYKQALEERMDIVVKMDGDGQMDGRLLPRMVEPLLREECDYTKGNRFYKPGYLQHMPFFRIVGNAVLSFLNKISSGYWNLMDPTNGYTAIHKKALSQLPIEKLNKRFFFESDMLYQLGLARAVVWDIPFPSQYADEISNLKIYRIILPFLFLYGERIMKRLFYSYLLRDFNLGSLEAVSGFFFAFFGGLFGGYHWMISIQENKPATAGTVMLSGVPLIVGIQLILSALLYDVSRIPKIPLQKLM